MKTNLFARVFLLGCLAVCGIEALASGGVNGKPNLIEGGYVYSYDSTYGNAPFSVCQTNVLGRIPHQVENYVPPMGQTNAIFLARSESFSVSTNYEFVGWAGYGDQRPSETESSYLKWEDEGDRLVFKAKNSIGVSPERYAGGDRTSCYFRRALPEGGYEYGKLQVFFVNRSDAFYRMPRNDTYYVVPNTTLWFCRFSRDESSPWPETGDGWTKTHVGNFDKFTITAGVNETVHLESVDCARCVTVHVVDQDFKFTSHVLLFKYDNDRRFETRKLSTILYECQENYRLDEIESVVSVDGTKGVAVVKDGTTGDYSLTPLDYHDFDRLVVVTLKDGKGVILLKITSVTGRCDETLCSRNLPNVVYGSGTFKSLITDDDGNEVVAPLWEAAVGVSRNVPPGYPYVARSKNCVLYNGKRYTLYIACKTPDFWTDTSNPDAYGQTACVKALRKIVSWLEDMDGNLFASPAFGIGNCGYSTLHSTRFCLGTANCLYTNDKILSMTRSGDDYRADDLYLGTVLTSRYLFQGATADAYGYCAMLACAADQGDPTTFIDEMTVFLIGDVQTVTVSKTVVGGKTTDRFLFEEEHELVNGDTRMVVTNHFYLADGDVWSFAVAKGGFVRVTEIPQTGYLTKVRGSATEAFRASAEIRVSSVTEDRIFEFRNECATEQNPQSLWITDHADAGDGKVHLAFDPDFGDQSVALASWLEKARDQDAIHTAHARTEKELETASPDPVDYRDGTGARDLDKHWVWITADSSDISADDVKFLCWKILIDPVKGVIPAYEDEVLSCTVPPGPITRSKVDENVDAYTFTNLPGTAEIQLRRPSRVKSVLLVGGGGGGGAALGGGGGGGEVRLVGDRQFGTERLQAGQILCINVGQGGSPSPYADLPGDNGGETVLVCGSQTYRVLGGGGGGSSNSKYPGEATRGRGRAGANGGGSAAAAIGGASVLADGFAGGRAAGANSGTGGGGSLSGTGGDGNGSVSGQGSDGVTLTIGGRSATYGAGGGGGGSDSVTPGTGGDETAGDGAHDARAIGGDAVDGFGGGGGGGGVRGGRGGGGTVIIELQDASVIDAFARAEGVSFFSAKFMARLESLALGPEHTASIYFAFAPGDEELVFGDEPFATGVVPGTTLNHAEWDLVSDTDYRYAFKFVDEAGNTLVSSGTFRTNPSDDTMEDRGEYFYATKGLAIKEAADGSYRVMAQSCMSNACVILKKDLVLDECLVVGGGGAGGARTGGGGGGGGVVHSDQTRLLAAGTKLVFSVGAGGAVYGNDASTVNGDGGSSFLTIDDGDCVRADGGGAGAGWDEENGHPGGNGGGGVKIAGKGGEATMAGGTVGGSAAGQRRNYGDYDCLSGGGGGAGAPGGNAIREYSRTGGDTWSKSGSGGEGLAFDITGEPVVYGSGGGGGGEQLLYPGDGGTNGGTGGNYNGAAATAGVDGTGGGGGGAGWDSSGGAGRGGDGAVVFRMLKRDAAYGKAEVCSVDYNEATLAATLLATKEGESTASVAFFYGKKGQPLDFVSRVDGVKVETVLTNRLVGLDFDSEYAYRYDFITADGSGTNSVPGEFVVETGYEDDNVLISGVSNGFSPIPVTGTVGVYAFTDVVDGGRVRLKRAFRLDRALVVGGGGAGGFCIGGGGGGGQVTELMNAAAFLSAGAELNFAVGAGGASATNRNDLGTNGGDSALKFQGFDLTAVGGGAGASYLSTVASGGNGGGGSHMSATGGVSVVQGGHAGGSFEQVGRNPYSGGGGGADQDGESGQEATNTCGAGGMGRASEITGARIVYGSGGGGGGGKEEATLYSKAGMGGENGGNGGDPSAVDPALIAGGKGVDGTGAGGGGGGYVKSGNPHAGDYIGGAGGSGAVIFGLIERSPIEESVRVVETRTFGADLEAKVLVLDASVEDVEVLYAYAKKGETMPDFVSVTNGLKVGESVIIRIPELDQETEYDYQVQVKGGEIVKTASGSFKTQPLGFDPGYDDGHIVIDGVEGVDFYVKEIDGEKALVFTNVNRSSTILVKRHGESIVDALVVGGGGAGGARTGGGGGGGGVLAPFEETPVALHPGDELSVVVGKGGAVLGNGDCDVNEDGGPSTLSVAGTDYSALGGGAGAGWNELNGHDGGNGGGGVKVAGKGGVSLSNGNKGGSAGGEKRYYLYPNGFDCMSGGGGGAGAPGGNAIYMYENVGGEAGWASKSGSGGEGLGFDITGERVVYGSGGGGGGEQYLYPGDGGTNGGTGGYYNGAAATAGVDGTGGGGGGSGYGSGNAGRGGNGTVIIRLGVTPEPGPIGGTAKVSAKSKDAALVTGKVASLGEGIEEVDEVYYAVESVTAPKKLMLAAANVDPKYTKIEGVGPLKVGDTFSFKIPGLVAGTQYRYTLLFVSGEIQQTTEGRFETLPADAQQVAVNEFMASNGDSLVTVNGKEGLDWIELRNDGDRAENVSGWYLSDNPDKAESKWKKIEGSAVVPAHGTLVVWADKDYDGFTAAEPFVRTGLGKDGGSVFLANPLGEVLSRVDYPEQIKDISYGSDTSGKLGFFDPSTPGVANVGNALNLPTPAVAFDVPHGYKTEAFDVGISCPGDANAEIHYTTDGSKPTSTSPLYTERITVDRTTCLRAAVVDENSVLQNDASATYIFLDDVLQQSTETPAGFPASGAVNGHRMVYGMNPDVVNGPDRERLLKGFTNSIATISFVIDPKALFDKETGIYVHSENVNSGKAWERPVLVEQIDPVRGSDNEFSAVAGLRLRGGNSRDNKYVKHAFRLFFRGEYGMSKLKFPLFGDEGADEFDKVDLRCSQNYSWASEDSTGDTFIHEVFSRDTQRDLGVHYTRSRYYHLYINGQYWGLYQSQERGDEDFAETYNGGKADDYDVIKTDDQGTYKPTVASAGDMEAWSELWRIAMSEGVEGERAANYQRLLGCNPGGTRNPDYPVLLNPTNLIAFMLDAHYMVDHDSPVAGSIPNNLYCLRDRKDGKAKEDGFFYLRHDAEHALGVTSYGCDYDCDSTVWGTAAYSSDCKQFAKFTPAGLFYELCKHPDFRMMVADAFYKHCLKPGGALTAEKAAERFRARMEEIDDAVVCESARWARRGQTRATWLAACETCFTFIANRMSHMTQHYRNRGWYPSIDAPTIAIAEGRATFTAANPVYYTLDGSDPRTNGTLAPAEGVTLPATGTTLVRARCKSAAGEWSALDEAMVN